MGRWVRARSGASVPDRFIDTPANWSPPINFSITLTDALFCRFSAHILENDTNNHLLYD